MEDPVIVSPASFHSTTSSTAATISGTTTTTTSRARDSTMDILRRFGTKRSKASSATSSKPAQKSTIPKSSRLPPPPAPSPLQPNTNPFTATTTIPTRRPPPPSSSSSSNVNNNVGAPPPPYSAAPAADLAPSPATTNPVAGDDSPYAFLREFDTVFLIDDSGSMAGRSWRETEAALSAIAPICTSHDADGIDIYFLNHRNPNSTSTSTSGWSSHSTSNGSSGLGGYTNITTTAAVQDLFRRVRPLGGTPTGTRLNQLLKPYLAQVAQATTTATVKPLNIIVITDGVPSDDVESVIVSAAKKLDAWGAEPWQVGIQFFQVGREPEAAEMLRELDDTLSANYGIRDMVDTVPWSRDDQAGGDGQQLTAQGLLKVCLGSVVRRHDRRAA